MMFSLPANVTGKVHSGYLWVNFGASWAGKTYIWAPSWCTHTGSIAVSCFGTPRTSPLSVAHRKRSLGPKMAKLQTVPDGFSLVYLQENYGCTQLRTMWDQCTFALTTEP